MADIYRDQVEILLIEWGRAARADTIRLGVPIGLLGRIKGSTVRSAMIEPDDFERVDQAVSELNNINKLLHDVAGLIYIQGKTYNQVAKEIGKGRTTVYAYKKAVIDHTASYLNFNDE